MVRTLASYRPTLAAIPALARFCQEAEEVVRAGDTESFWKAEPAFQELLRSNFVEAFITHELNEVAQDPYHFLHGSSEVHAAVVELPGYALSLKFLTPDSVAGAPLLSLAEHLFLAVWDGSTKVQRFTIEPPFRHDVFDRSKRLIVEPELELVPGMAARFRSPHNLLRVRVERPLLMIQLHSASVVPLRWVFHPETLEPVRAVASRLSSSRLQFTCHTLAALGSTTSLPALKKLMTHSEHYVRWAAVQGICAISREQGISCLRQSLEDDHPHIQIAAQETLADLEREAEDGADHRL